MLLFNKNVEATGVLGASGRDNVNNALYGFDLLVHIEQGLGGSVDQGEYVGVGQEVCLHL